MASVATGPSKPTFQCLYLDGSVRKSTRTVSPSAMSCLPRATGLSQNDPERLGPLRAEILPAVRRAAVEQRAVTGLEQVAVAGVVQGDLAVDHVEELHLAALDDDLLGRDPALLGPERRDDRADLALEEPGAQHRPALRRAVEADDGVVLQRVTTIEPEGWPSNSAPIGTPSAAAIRPSVWSDGVSRPDSICDTMLGVRSAFSASWRCCSSRSARRPLMRSPSVVTRPPPPASRPGRAPPGTRAHARRIRASSSSGKDA